MEINGYRSFGLSSPREAEIFAALNKVLREVEEQFRDAGEGSMADAIRNFRNSKGGSTVGPPPEPPKGNSPQEWAKYRQELQEWQQKMDEALRQQSGQSIAVGSTVTSRLGLDGFPGQGEESDQPIDALEAGPAAPRPVVTAPQRQDLPREPDPET